jgi:hypothetical protein
MISNPFPAPNQQNSAILPVFAEGLSAFELGQSAMVAPTAVFTNPFPAPNQQNVTRMAVFTEGLVIIILQEVKDRLRVTVDGLS